MAKKMAQEQLEKEKEKERSDFLIQQYEEAIKTLDFELFAHLKSLEPKSEAVKQVERMTDLFFDTLRSRQVVPSI